MGLYIARVDAGGDSVSFFKTVAVPDRGIDYALEPHAIDPRAWFLLQWWRTRNGTIRSFPGWDNILPSPLGAPIHGLSEYFKPLTNEFFHVILTDTQAYSLNPVTGATANITGAATLNGSSEDPFSLIQFGGAIHLTSKYTDGLYKWDGTGTLQRIFDGDPLLSAPPAPTFAFIATLNDYLIGIYERFGDEHYPYSFRWAAEGSDSRWTAAETTDAGEFPLSDTPDRGVALYRLGNDICAYKERTIIPVTFIGGNEVFGRRAGVHGAGLIGPYALAAPGDRHIFMGQETFYSYTGGNVVDDSIGDTIRDLVYREINHPVSNQVRTLMLRQSLEIAFFYPSINNGTGIGCDRAVIYNLKDGTWAGPMSIVDFVTFCNTFMSVEPDPIDVLGTKASKLMQHGTSFTEDGLTINRLMESGDHNLQSDATDQDGNKVFFPLSTVFLANVLNIDIENMVGNPVATVSVGCRLDLNDPINWQGPFPLIGGGAQRIRVPIRRTGRWFRVRIECADNKEFAVQGYQFEFERVGYR